MFKPHVEDREAATSVTLSTRPGRTDGVDALTGAVSARVTTPTRRKTTGEQQRGMCCCARDLGLERRSEGVRGGHLLVSLSGGVGRPRRERGWVLIDSCTLPKKKPSTRVALKGVRTPGKGRLCVRVTPDEETSLEAKRDISTCRPPRTTQRAQQEPPSRPSLITRIDRLSSRAGTRGTRPTGGGQHGTPSSSSRPTTHTDSRATTTTRWIETQSARDDAPGEPSYGRCHRSWRVESVQDTCKGTSSVTGVAC